MASATSSCSIGAEFVEPFAGDAAEIDPQNVGERRGCEPDAARQRLIRLDRDGEAGEAEHEIDDEGAQDAAAGCIELIATDGTLQKPLRGGGVTVSYTRLRVCASDRCHLSIPRAKNGLEPERK
ncbi:hypothetical protein [Methylobacterium komagatae]